VLSVLEGHAGGVERHHGQTRSLDGGSLGDPGCLQRLLSRSQGRLGQLEDLVVRRGSHAASDARDWRINTGIRGISP
jgi:hypothetical protein